MITVFNSFNYMINEKIDDYNLYHFTTVESLYEIYKDGWLYTIYDKYNGNKALSTTRNKNLNWFTKKNNIRLSFDKRELSKKYKIKPYHWFNDRHGVDYRSKGNNATPNGNQDIPVNQYEERVISNNPIPIKYITDINIIGSISNKDKIIIQKLKLKLKN